MTNVFEDPAHPDGRQSPDTTHQTSRFRPTYRALTDDEKGLHDAIKTQAEVLEALFDRVSEMRMKHGHTAQPRYHALAMTALEESIMWAIKGLTA